MHYEEHSENDYICHQGQVGDKFYIMLSGTVNVSISTQKDPINSLHAGDSFGELALLTSQPRNATIRCTEKCSFAILDKQAFKQILYNIRSREIEQITTFLQSVTIFQYLTKATIRSFIYNIQEHTLFKGQVIFSENEMADKFYIIKSGEVLLSKSFESKTDSKLSEIYLASRRRKKY